MWHFLLVSSRWSVEREQFVANVMLSDISPALKARLGSIAANPDIWLRLGGPLHEMGVEYTEAIAVRVTLSRFTASLWIDVQERSL